MFLPAITGFSEFVNDTEINHSQHIISELLEVILKSNEIDLKVAEIEGDAVFFYRDEVPEIDEIVAQAKKMFINFHHHLRKYESLRICQCGVCRSATDLTLKFIAHAGPYTFIDLNGFHKPYGNEVVKAYRLLKNAIPDNEYLLLTHDLLQLKENTIKDEWIQFKNGEDPVNQIYYSYIPFDYLYYLVPPVEHFELPQKTKNPVRYDSIIQAPVDRVHSVLLDFDLKSKWIDDMSKVEYDKSRINQVGMGHTCTIQNRNLRFETIGNDFGAGKWVYGEKLLNPPLVREADFYYILKKIDNQSTLLSLELHYVPLKGILKILSLIFRLMFRQMFINNILNLRRLCDIRNVTQSVAGNLICLV